MARYQVILAYDGTQFYGFQRQADPQKAHGPAGEAKDSQPGHQVRSTGRRTVQGVVEAALRQIGWQGQAILGAGRTDTGVHATGQVITFDLDWKHSTEDLHAALNARLPVDVSALKMRVAVPGFHPRYSALARRYCYRLFCQPARNPLRERYAWRIWPPVGLERLQRSTGYILGTHDFAAFGTLPRTAGSTIRTIIQAEWLEEPAPPGWVSGLAFEITANAFLYHMVRRLVTSQVAVGQGRLAPEAILAALKTGQLPVQGLAPPHGLTLEAVLYPWGENDQDG